MKRIDELAEHIHKCNKQELTPERWLPELMVEIAISLARICDALEATNTEPEEDKE